MLGVHNTTLVQPVDAIVVWGMVASSYIAILGTIWSCGQYVKARLHDFATECALERERQNEMIDRLLMEREDTE